MINPIVQIFDWWSHFSFFKETGAKIRADEIHLFNLPEGANHISIINKDNNDAYFNTATKCDEIKVKIPLGVKVIIWVLPRTNGIKSYTFELGG